jgi:hypothetical protein
VAVASVQRKAKGAQGASVSIGSADGWATPTAGNLLVFSANSDATVVLSGAGTVSSGPSVVDGNGTYSWYKFATGAETTITATPSVSDDIVLTACEYSGVLAFDVQNSSTIAGVPGTTSTSSVSVTTTAANGLVVAFACLHSSNSSAQASGPSWTGGLTNVLNTASQGAVPTTNGTYCNTLVGELLGSGSTGAHAQVASWTSGFSNAQALVLAFKPTVATVGKILRPTTVRQAVSRAGNW